jgi:23S rRNA (guanosine2251-2'-O)-methyltransferase
LLYGRNAVLEVLRADRRRVTRLILARDLRESENLQQIEEHARAHNIPLERVDRSELNVLAHGHQGVVAESSPFQYSRVTDILARAGEENQAPLVLLLDILQDPQNVGTLIRTAFAVGAHGVILPPRRGVGITPGVVAASAGTCEHMLVAVANIAQAIRQLKGADVWIVGLEARPQAQTLDRFDIPGGIGLVIGGEEKGMRRLVRESCDALVRLPMRPGVDSLNAAVAGSIVLYALWQARGYSGAEV